MNIYSIVMKKSVFFKHSDQIVASSVRILDGQVYFKTDQITKKYLDENKVSYKEIDNLKTKIAKGIALNISLILSFLIFILVVYMNSFRVSGIEFNGEYAINQFIKTHIESKYTHFLVWNFIDEDYEEMSRQLRCTYPSYEWISTSKEGSKIVVTINNEEDIKINTNTEKGNIVAKKNCVISSFKVFQGVSTVYENQYIKQGDILIDGNINDTIIGAKGVVLGITYEEITKRIPKEEITVGLTGNKTKYTLINLFGKNIVLGKKNKFENYKTNRVLKFNLFDFFRIYKIEELEIYDIINTNSLNDAINKAQRQIIDDFNSNKTLNEEEILKIHLLYSSENTDEYVLRFLTKKKESVGEFISY